MVQTPHGIVVVYVPNERYGSPHEQVTRAEIARRLAALKGFDFADAYDNAKSHTGPVYIVPSDTLVGLDAAHALGIHSEHDLFGGVVPYPFVATKAITHPLIEPSVAAPAGWSYELGERIQEAVLFGFSVFTLEDARGAGARLLEHGPVRIKPVRETGGLGQTVVAEATALERALTALDSAELSNYGLVLEEDLTEVTTYSVGQVRVADLVATYYGTQRLTPNKSGAAVYGGSDLVVVRGDFDALLALDLSEAARLAITQGRAYDAAAREVFPGMIVSRCNYDVAQGVDAHGRQRSGVLEQSWRLGGASGAEIATLEAFRADPNLRAVRASTIEIHGNSEPPPHATVYFRGIDEQVGPMTKYALVEPYDNP